MFNPMHALTFFKYVYHLVQRIIGEKVETKTRWLTGDVIWLCLIQISLWFCFSVIYRFNTLVTFSTFVNKCFYTCDQLLNLCLQHTGTTYSTLFYTFFLPLFCTPTTWNFLVSRSIEKMFWVFLFAFVTAAHFHLGGYYRAFLIFSPPL